MNLLIIGAGEHGRVVKEIAVFMGMYDRIAFLDDNAPNAIGKISDHKNFSDEFECAFVAIGDPDIRKKITDELKEAGYIIPALVHPEAYVSSSARINAGTVVMPKAAIQAGVRVGYSCIISAGAIIDHDSTINEFCHINAGAIIPAKTEMPAYTKVDYGVVYNS